MEYRYVTQTIFLVVLVSQCISKCVWWLDEADKVVFFPSRNPARQKMIKVLSDNLQLAVSSSMYLEQHQNIRLLTSMRRVKCHPRNASLSAIVNEMITNLAYKVSAWNVIPAGT